MFQIILGKHSTCYYFCFETECSLKFTLLCSRKQFILGKLNGFELIEQAVNALILISFKQNKRTLFLRLFYVPF